MAGGFCLPDQYKLVGICIGKLCFHIYCNHYREFPGNKSGAHKPCKKFKNGIIISVRWCAATVHYRTPNASINLITVEK